ncbi:MAG TPA: tetratricopeptide repeat protein [Burkholderiaceae bacterium]|nr:tetratricopeptide repeat protein [Burkholderiaceae bacterium]
MLAGLFAAILVVAGLAIWAWRAGEQVLPVGYEGRTVGLPTFVGSQTCALCHRAQAELWRSSQHKRAMDHATNESVLGDFNNTTFDYFGVRSQFFRKDGKFLVKTDGPDGRLTEYEIKYTFGVDPLQQYLIEFPDGRLQALSIAWDTRPKAQGGQRWFHLYPNEKIAHDDVLHWTKLDQNWNFMCAECHSTGVRKNYDPAKNRFATSYAEISVGCEACHGQGSAHVAWAKRERGGWPWNKKDDPSRGLLVKFDERRDIAWLANAATGHPARSRTPETLRKEVEACGRCHSRRAALSEDWIPGHWLSDTHDVSGLTQGLYQADGQMLDEVYNYGSFKQSKMFAAGVTCSDCHEPHSGGLRAPGNGVCLQCHASGKYEATAHRHHDSAKSSVTCASCHMPTRTYMVVDRRHDHGIRIPRPDLSQRFGTTNACNVCHVDKSAKWAQEAIERWFGPGRSATGGYAEAFAAAWAEQPTSAKLLATAASDPNNSAFVRAGALSELASQGSPPDLDLARSALSDPDPMVRIGALDMLAVVPGQQVWSLVSPLLSDSDRGVRIRAVSLLASVSAAIQPPEDRDRFERAAAEFVAAQRLNADRPEARSALGNFFIQRGQITEAEIEYKAALRLSPSFSPAAVNLADLYRQLGREGDATQTLRAALAVSPKDAGIHHALGLALVRQKKKEEAIEELRLAQRLDPNRARYSYVYAAALYSTGHTEEAVRTWQAGLRRHPNDRETLSALVGISLDTGDIGSALQYAQRLAQLSPADKNLSALIDSLKQQYVSPQR